MKRVYILFSAVLLSVNLFAQTANTAAEVPAKAEPKHYFNLYGKAGYAAMLDNLGTYSKNTGSGDYSNFDFSNKSLLGGPGLGLGLTYELELGHFLFDAGFEFDWLRSTSKYNFGVTRNLVEPYPMVYNYRFINYGETRNAAYVGVPIMVGAQFNRYYFLVGAKVGYGLMANYKNFGTYDVTAQDPEMEGPIGGTSHGLGLHEIEKGEAGYQGKLTLKQPDVRLMAEVGVDLDEWLQATKAKRKTGSAQKGKKSKYEPFTKKDIHYRVGLFAEYGLLNQNGNASALPFEYTDEHAVAPSKSNSTYALENNGSKAAVNNLFVGVKFTVQFNVFNKKKVIPPTPPSWFILNIQDEQGNPISAQVQVKNEDKQKVTIQGKDIKNGRMAQRYRPGNYSMRIMRADYYTDSITFTVQKSEVGGDPWKDSITVVLRQLPKIEEIVETPEIVGQTFVLHNMFFATNKTNILEGSEEALQTLYDYLTANPDSRIKIIGHTDSVGSDEFNQKLSEGRAQAIREALIQRGIDENRVEAEGRGETEPVADNETEEGRQENRRVEIEILQ